MGKIHQVHTTIACVMASLISASLSVWPSYTIAEFTSNTTTVLNSPMSTFEASLVGSLPALGAMAGTVVVGTIIDGLGRKNGGLVIAMPYLFSWLIMNMTSSTLVILIARFMAGISIGASSVHAPIFISEVAEESIRGMLSGSPIAFYCIGAMVSYIMGWTMSYRYIIWANLALCVLYIALLTSVKESPVYLMKKNREEEARQSIAHYKGGSVDSKSVLEELSVLKQRVQPAAKIIPASDAEAEKQEKENLDNEDIEDNSDKKMPAYKMLFVSPSSRRAFTVVGLAISTQVMMGMVPVQVYAKDIFAQAAPSLSSHMCSVLFALVLMGGSISTAVFSDKFGRRPLLLASAVSVGVSLVALGILMQTNIAPPVVTAVIILFYCFAFMFGAGTVPYILLAEAFVSEVQSLASMILMEWVWLLNFVILAIFPYMVQLFGMHGSFYCFAVFAVIDVLIGIFLVPETKGLTNEQIQEEFLGRRKK